MPLHGTPTNRMLFLSKTALSPRSIGFRATRTTRITWKHISMSLNLQSLAHTSTWCTSITKVKACFRLCISDTSALVIHLLLSSHKIRPTLRSRINLMRTDMTSLKALIHWNFLALERSPKGTCCVTITSTLQH